VKNSAGIFRKMISQPKAADYLLKTMSFITILLSLDACINGNPSKATTTFGIAMILWGASGNLEFLTRPISHLGNQKSYRNDKWYLEFFGFIFFITGLFGGLMDK
jgi:hypothetical protein